MELEQITYYRLSGPPTLKQYLIRRHMRQVAQRVVGATGTTIIDGRLLPRSAIRMSSYLKGMTAERIASEHPDWVEEWKRLFSS